MRSMATKSPFRSSRDEARFISTYDATMRRLSVPFDEQDVATTFGKTHVFVSGPRSAPPLVLLHGAGATSAMWNPILPVLSRDYRCYCIDTITDANKSIATQPVRGVSDYVDWLEQVFAGLDITSARVAGLSYGGWLAALLALHAPQRVSHLILLTPAATLAPLTIQFFARMVTPNVLRSSSLMRRSVQWLSTKPITGSDPSVELLLVNAMSCRPFRQEMMIPAVLTDDELRRIGGQVTVLIGDRDVIYRGGPKAALARAAQCIPNARTHLLPNANHILTHDCPEVLVTQMREALT
jgi:pimeloyl-ACP methyl ester carboxylesterase